MEHKPIYLDGVDVSGCKKLHWDIAPFLKKEERPFNQHEWKCGGGFTQTYCHNDKNCLYKQLKRKTQECEQIKEKYEALKLENQEGYEIVAELKHECEELKKKLRDLELKNTILQNRYQQLDGAIIECGCYRKALEEVEKAIATYSSKHQYSIANDLYNQIFDIINKAKGE